MKAIHKQFMIVVVTGLLTLTVTGCSLPTRKPAVPKTLSDQAELPGMPGVRYIVQDADMANIRAEAMDSLHKEKAYFASQGKLKGDSLPPTNFLAISGGGDDGAFGAGLLCGWTAAGTRPTFKLVTGISTGALLAPFAFLGPKYDNVLKAVYTASSAKDIMEPRSLISAVTDDAMADNAPLGRMIAKYVTPELLKEVATEYSHGRLLLLATTNLDSRQAVIWNMTKVAASGHPDAIKLFHKIMLASAAIPGAFPPAMVDVVANGKAYQEMHVDGGTMAQVFVYPPSLRLKSAVNAEGVERERHLYVIRNARLDSDWADTQRQALSIANRAITSLIQTQGVGDLFKIYATSERDDIDFNLAFIPASFHAEHKEDFDPKYMQSLFNTGYSMAVKGYPWLKRPPGL